jgi:VIT1/CCC1 family predicted Fe2+/Mn2+ transporter
VIAGAVPLLIYFADLLFHFDLSTATVFFFALTLSGLALLALGAAKVFVTKRSAIRSAVEMLLVGGLAALVAFVVGTLLKNLVGNPQTGDGTTGNQKQKRFSLLGKKVP